MQNKKGQVIFAALLLLVFRLAFYSVANAQTPVPPPTRESLIEEIQLRAQSDVDNGKSMESTEGLNALFGEQAKQAGMSLTEVVGIYEHEYKIAKAAKPWWEGWLPNLGWVAAFIALLAAIFRGAIEEAGKKFVNTVGAAIYNRVARYRPFWMFALRKYRQSLEKTYCELKIPFRAGRPLEMKDVYVPVRVDGGDKKQVDAYQTIQNQKRLVVLGDPGSGKTMFLRHVAFTYARQGLDDFDGQPVPVYLELNRVESAGGDLLAALTKTLENHNFPGADGFLKSALENQSLLILLDGLDEVNAAARPALVKQIQDLDQKHAGNRMIVTCRKAVYQGELDTWVDKKLEIIEFSDQQIQRFMTSWQKDMPAEKSIEHFFRTLQERPQIMALARNPLLLTMVAYLYVDTEFALPHSRSEFYSRSTDLLLDQWKLERNRYKATHKRIVLQRLASFNQSQAGKTGERRTLELADVLKEIRDVLPDLTLKTEDAQPLLDEIVQRSGLMLTIDGGTRYLFTHLTLQEYFAARALEADQKGLLDFYRAAPDAWREVVRLWCALEHDSTAMLKELYTLDPVMAFECLSDAQQVDNAYAHEMIQSFQPRLLDALTNESLASAFALLAADPRKRGKKWFEFLKETLNDKSKRKRLATCAVLARMNMFQAAEALVNLAKIEPDVIPFLIQLGNLAVPALTEPIQKGEEWAMDALVDIGTPQAALSLQAILWTEEPKSYRAAWRLAALLPLSGVEETLQAISLTSEQLKAKQIEWIWEPFSENANLKAITGRIALLLHTTPKTFQMKKDLNCDLRLVIPLCTIVSQDGQLEKIEDRKRKKLLEKAGQPNFITYAREISTYPIWSYLFNTLPMSLQPRVLSILIQNEPIPSPDDWRNLFRPLRYVFEGSIQAIAIKSIIFFLGFLNLWSIIVNMRQRPPLWSDENLMMLFLFTSISFIILLSVWRGKWRLLNLGMTLSILGMGIGAALGVSAWVLSNDWLFTITMLVIGSIVSFIISIVCQKITSNINDVEIIGGDFGDFIVMIAFLSILFGSMFIIPLFTFTSFTSEIFSKGGGIIGINLIFMAVCSVIIGISTIVSVNNGKISVIKDPAIEEKFRSRYYLGIPKSILNSILINSSSSNIAFGIEKGVRPVSILLGSIWGLYICAIDCLFMYLPTKLLYYTWGGNITLSFWMVYFSCFIFLIWFGKRQQRRAQNPLHGLLEPSGAVSASYSSFSQLSKSSGTGKTVSAMKLVNRIFSENQPPKTPK